MRTPFSLTAVPSLRPLLTLARRYAAASAPVLITGETGVGKDALARYLHTSGPRRHDPFVIVDCPALPATLVEAELFGHERGAFTDATIARAGRFELGGRGTIYLDAIEALNMPGQGTLLRVVEERLVTRLGGTRPIALHARFIASAGGDLEARVADGAFRPELLHRLRVLTLHVPPLRERPCDILPLAQHIVRETCRSMNRPVALIRHDCADALRRYAWPGNIRELRHVLERVLLLSPSDALRARDLPPEVTEGEPARRPAQAQPLTLAEVESRHIASVLRLSGGNQSRAAALLGISRKSLWERRRRFGLR